MGSYWTPEIARQTLLIDPQRGTLKQQRLVSEDTVALVIGRSPVEATRYTVAGLTNGWVAYDHIGRWLSAELKKRDPTSSIACEAERHRPDRRVA